MFSHDDQFQEKSDSSAPISGFIVIWELVKTGSNHFVHFSLSKKKEFSGNNHFEASAGGGGLRGSHRGHIDVGDGYW